jgi:hypothetical protein
MLMIFNLKKNFYIIELQADAYITNITFFF